MVSPSLFFGASFEQDDGVLVIPTTSEPPPKLGAKEILTEDYQMSTSTLTSLVSMSGCCQVRVYSQAWTDFAFT